MITGYSEVLSRVRTKRMMYEVMKCTRQEQFSYKALDVLVTTLGKSKQKRITVLYCNGQLMFTQTGLGNAPKELVNDLHILFRNM